MDTRKQPKAKPLSKRRAEARVADRLEQLAKRPPKNAGRARRTRGGMFLWQEKARLCWDEVYAPLPADARIGSLCCTLCRNAMNAKRPSLRGGQVHSVSWGLWPPYASQGVPEYILAPLSAESRAASCAYDRAHRLLLRLVLRGVERSQ